MNRRDTQLERDAAMSRWRGSEEDFAQLEELLRNDSEFRMDYLRYLNVDLALAALPKSGEQAAGRPGRDPSQPSPVQGLARWWFGWAAAAARCCRSPGC